MEEGYRSIPLNELVRIRRLYSFHYFQFASGYLFPGESHDFWEMVYIDRGEADIGAGERVVRLSQGQVILHEPGEFHSIWAGSPGGSDILVVSFACDSAAIRRLRQGVFTLSTGQRRLLMSLVAEGRGLFGPVLDISEQKEPVPRPDAPEGSRQMIALLLTQFLILLLRERQAAKTPPAEGAPHLTEEQRAAEVIAHLTALMRRHPDGSLRFPEICRASGLGQTALKECFRRYQHQSVMACYRRIRIEEARRLLREGRLNVTQVAEALGYSSLPYFSAQFRREMGMSPLQYLRTVRE